MRKNLSQFIVFLFLFSNIVSLFATTPVLGASRRFSHGLTAEEKAYVEKSEPIKVALSPDNFPYSVMTSGTMTGVFPELLSIIAYETGLEFEILPCTTYSEYSEIKKNKEAEIVLATHVLESEALELGYQLTSAYIKIPYSKIELKENKASTASVATLEMPSAEATKAAESYYTDQIQYYGSKEECMEALDNHKCEAVIVNSYNAEYIQSTDVKSRYIVKELYDNTIGVSAGIRLDADPMLYQIMQKSLLFLDDMTKEEIINRNTQQRQKQTTLVELMYINPVVFIGGIASFFLLLCGIIFWVFRIKKAALLREQTAEYMRFVGYICAAVDVVTELNIKDRTMTRYTMKDGTLKEEFEPYPEDEWIMFDEEERNKMKQIFTDEKLMELCKNDKTYYSECRMRWNHSKEYHWCTCILQGIHPSKEKPFNLLLILKDTQEVKANELRQKKALEDAFRMAKQASQAKGTFLSKMSHEIRTPLNAIIGYLSLAKDSEQNIEKIMHCVNNSEIAAKHLLHIINDVLDISSIESGKMKIAHDDFDLKKEITDISTIFFQNAKGKGLKFEVHIKKLTQEWVVGDSLRLNQVLMNLLSNALKFTPKDGIVQLQIEQLNEDETKVYIQFVVSDTGIGMSEEYMSRLFMPFEQESAMTAQKYGGTGLGLSITNNLVSMMGGTMGVQSVQNQGSTFTVTLHFDKSAKNEVTRLTSADYSHVRALVVDDQKDEGTYVKAMLKRCGVKSDSVISGADALKRIRSRQGSDYSYDLCIVDWNMPNMNGVETAKRIRQEFGSEIPIIIATAYDISEFIEQAKEIGVNKVVAKPLFQSTLFDLLVSTFGEYNPTQGQEELTDKIDMSGIRLILAEDNEMNMEIAVTVLEKAGVQVEQAVNGQEAYQLFLDSAPKTYNLILMDVQMPILNGYEATRKIRSSNHPEAKTIPIVAMTANAFAEDVAEALSNGMNDHIAKPVNYEKLFQVLRKYNS